jgi:hypothetical protein
VLHTLRAMESRGHIKIEWGKQGRGHCSKFWMSDGEEKVHARTFMKHAKGAAKGASVTLKGAPVHQNYIKNHLNPERDAKVPFTGRAERANAPTTSRSCSRFG